MPLTIPDMRKPITRETTIGYPPVIGLVGLSSLLMWWFPKLLLHKWRPSSAGLLCALDPQARPVLHGHLWHATKGHVSSFISSSLLDFETDFPQTSFCK